MKILKSLLFFALVCLSVVFTSCEKENIGQDKTITNLSELTSETAESLARQYTESDFSFPEVHKYIEKIQQAKVDGELTLNEIEAIGELSNRNFVFALVGIYSFSSDEIQGFINAYEEEQAAQSRGNYHYKWTNGAKVKYGFWRWTYYRYPCYKFSKGFGVSCHTLPGIPIIRNMKCKDITCNIPSDCN